MITGLTTAEHWCKDWEAETIHIFAEGCIVRGKDREDAIVLTMEFMTSLGFAGPIEDVHRIVLSVYAERGLD